MSRKIYDQCSRVVFEHEFSSPEDFAKSKKILKSDIKFIYATIKDELKKVSNQINNDSPLTFLLDPGLQEKQNKLTLAKNILEKSWKVLDRDLNVHNPQFPSRMSLVKKQGMKVEDSSEGELSVRQIKSIRSRSHKNIKLGPIPLNRYRTCLEKSEFANLMPQLDHILGQFQMSSFRSERSRNLAFNQALYQMIVNNYPKANTQRLLRSIEKQEGQLLSPETFIGHLKRADMFTTDTRLTTKEIQSNRMKKNIPDWKKPWKTSSLRRPQLHKSGKKTAQTNSLEEKF